MTLDQLQARATTDPIRTAVAAGALLGVGDLLLQNTLPYPYADLANSSGVWAVAALLLSFLLRLDVDRAASAGVVMLVVAVEAYYVAAVAFDLASPFRLLAPTTVMWVVLGVLSGALFATAGAWVRDPDPWRAAGGVALGVSVMLAEAVQRWDDAPSAAVLTGALGVALLALLADRRGAMACAAALTVPLVPVWVAAFRLAGFGI